MKKIFKIFWASIPFIVVYVGLGINLGFGIAIVPFGIVGAVFLWVYVASKLWPIPDRGSAYWPEKPTSGPNPFEKQDPVNRSEKDYSESILGVHLKPIGSHDTNPFDTPDRTKK